jgi:hypothetical protein
MLRRILNHLRTAEPPLLGRWCLKDKSKSDWKIDTANTDHCGTCSYENAKAPRLTTDETTAPVSKRGDEGVGGDK